LKRARKKNVCFFQCSIKRENKR